MLLFTLILALSSLAAELPPKVIYHVGHREFLLENDRAGTIPEAVWNESIMGRKTRYGLVPFRRGLYGGESFDTLELYANLLLGRPRGEVRTPWVMKITLKDECRQPAAVSNFSTDEKYLAWLLKNFDQVLKNTEFCVNRKAEDCGEVISGAQNVAGGREENACDDLLQSYLDEAKPRVVKDEEWKGSWYLRDRACIEKVEAGDGAVLETLATATWDQASRAGTFSGTPGGYGLGPLVMLMKALEGSEPAREEQLTLIRDKTAASDIRHGWQKTERAWVKDAGPAIIDAYRRCGAKGKDASFRAAAASFRDRLGEESLLKDPTMPDQLIALFAGLCAK